MTSDTEPAPAPPPKPEPGQSPASAAFAALGVCRPLADAAAALGWSTPTEIQAQAVPYALKGK
jgi:ATP-dependent RNA helicase DDX47/RRP3